MQLSAQSPHSQKVAGFIPALSWRSLHALCGFSPLPHSPNTCTETDSRTPCLLQTMLMFYQQHSFLLFEFWFCSQMTMMTFNNSARISPHHLPNSGIEVIATEQEGRAQRSFSVAVTVAVTFILNVTPVMSDGSIVCLFFSFFQNRPKSGEGA